MATRQTKNIKDVTTVTTVADASYMPIIDSAGGVTKATFANVRKAINNNHNLNEMENGIFIFALTNDTNNHRRLIKPSKWATYKNDCTAIGIAVQSGDKLLIVSLTETTLTWSTAQVTGGGFNNSNRKLAIRDWAGETNTTEQVKHSECSGTNCAPGWCHAYSRLNPNNQGLGAGTWWLPSLGELLLIWANFEKINYVLSLIDGATQLAETYYWSASEYSATNAWYIGFGTGLVGNYGNKVSGSLRVRAVSAFQ